MIRDYSVYNMSGNEKLLFYMVGYCCIFHHDIFVLHSITLSLISGVLIKIFLPYAEHRMAVKRMYAPEYAI